MRKKIAVLANGWGAEYLREVVTGAFEVARVRNMDIFTFVNFTRATNDRVQNFGEYNIFSLPDLNDFDGVILMANSFNMKEELDLALKKVSECNVPVISVEYEFEGIPTINSSNYYGMYELAQHIMKVHSAQNIVYIGGPEDHLESIERLKALQDAANENGFEIKKENIIYGDWAKASAIRVLEAWQIENTIMPEAIVCANDVMAMGAVDYCRTHGYRVPQDVIVTGYDCTDLAQNYIPSITSVSHEWAKMGKITMEALAHMIEGKKKIRIEDMKTRFICGESCGCQVKKVESEWGKYGRNPFYGRMAGFEYDSHYRHMYLAVRKVEDVASLYESLNQLFEKEHWMEGDNFSICIEPEFFNVEKGDQNLIHEGYSDKMAVVCAMKHGDARPFEFVSKREVLMRAQMEQDELQLYVVVPLASDNHIYGFSVLVRDMDIVLDNMLYSWMRHMSQYLEQVRRNITIADLTAKLTKQSVTDELTQIYNRAGCERIAYPMIMEKLKKGYSGVVLIADIDRMKDINDQYGHAGGDAALVTVASTISKIVPKGWITSRFGGDEFFVGGYRKDDSFDLDKLVQDIMDELHRQIEERKIQFDLSISVGYSVIPPDGAADLEKSLREADKLMYYVKNMHHKSMDALKKES